MGDNNTRLRELFFGGIPDAVEGFREQVEDSEEIKRLRKRLTSKVRGLDWVASWRTSSKMIGTILDLPLAKLLLTALKRYRELQDLSDPKKYPPDQEFRLSIDCRKLSTKHTPRLIFFHNGEKKAELVFTVKLTIHLELLQLVVQAGRIKRIELGECRGSGEILLNNHTVVKRELGELRLPASIDLGAGLPIPTDAEPDTEPPLEKQTRVSTSKGTAQAESGKGSGGCLRPLIIMILLMLLVAGAMWISKYGLHSLNELPRYLDHFFSQTIHAVPEYQYQAPPPQHSRQYGSQPATPYPPQELPNDQVTTPPPLRPRTHALFIDVTPPETIIHIEGPGYNGPYRPGIRLPRGKYKIRATTQDGAVRYDKFSIVNRDVHMRITVGGFH